MNVNNGSYACFRLCGRSSDRLQQWLADNQVPNPMDKNDFHITICYSKDPIPFTPLGYIPPVPIKPLGFDLFGKDKDYLVLRVHSRLAKNRNDYAMLAGAVSDFPDYRPHVSLAKDTGLTSVDDLSPFVHTLYANKEEYHILDLSFGKGVPKIDPGIIKYLFR